MRARQDIYSSSDVSRGIWIDSNAPPPERPEDMDGQKRAVPVEETRMRPGSTVRVREGTSM